MNDGKHYVGDHRRLNGRMLLECVLTDVAAVAGQDAEVLRRDAPPAADGAAEGGHGGVAAALHDFRERQLGVAQQVARHLHVPVHAQLGEGQARELLDSGRELRVRVIKGSVLLITI